MCWLCQCMRFVTENYSYASFLSIPFFLLQLFQNILASTELHFPSKILKELHPDCVDLCRSLLRRNPDERLTFKAFFNHDFVRDNNRSVVNIERFHSHQSESSMVNQLVGSASEKVSQAHSEYHVEKASHLMESVEKSYVLVNSHFASLEDFSDYFEASAQDNPSSKVSIRASNRLDLLHKYVQVLEELSQEKYNTGLYLESLAVELVVLAIWKKALDICSTWSAPISKNELHGSSSVNESVIACGDASLSHTIDHKINFNDRPSVSLWAKHGFINAVDRAEKLSYHIQNMDGAVEMPDAIEIIFTEALLIGTNGAVDEYMNNKDKSATSYSKAMLLLSFIVEEAENLPLNPPFSLLADDHKRIVQYIRNLRIQKISLSESLSEEAQ
ncbi:Serine/threonine-protein kinase ATG1a, variant 2 [Lathyrus oleraceus]|uniref:Serine/threonine-protein kinase ATG1a, variant 2 n=1 Tax=Pisum sativum TaxID=3888 RepID=A0A9D4XIX1_PEA|nr:Serine/threonine-protein kinase ATG1a, variant 2 [Pisum sativum]